MRVEMGQFCEGKLDGYGLRMDVGGNIIMGEFKQGSEVKTVGQEGNGNWYFGNTDYKTGNKHGEGTYFNSSSITLFSGTYFQNTRSGFGEEFSLDGSERKGIWKDRTLLEGSSLDKEGNKS